jgi:uncharacterized protein with beta-barrel porin domain
MSAVIGRSALALVLLSGTSGIALAACDTSSSNVVCSGTETSPITVGSPTTSNLIVTTQAGFGVDAATGDALNIEGMGGVFYTDDNASPITATDGRGLTVIAHADEDDDGSFVVVNTAGEINSWYTGVYVVNNGAGLVDVKVGDVTATSSGANGVDIITTSQTSSVTVSTGEVDAANTGIGVSFYSGPGVISIESSGSVSSTGHAGIVATSYGTATGVEIDVTGDVTGGGSNGIYGRMNGTGAAFVDFDIGGTVQGKENGIDVELSSSGTDLEIDAGSAIGDNARGIRAINNGTGSSSITVTGLVKGASEYDALLLDHHGAGNAVVDVETLEGGANGLYLTNYGRGDTIVDIRDKASASSSTGSGVSINNYTGSGYIDLEAVDVSGQYYGIFVGNSGIGDTLVTTTGFVEATAGQGIRVVNGATAGKVRVEAADVSGRGAGIKVDNSGTGPTGVVATGLVSSEVGNGVALSGSADVEVDVVDLHAGNETYTVAGIVLTSTGTANVTIRGEVYGSGLAISSSATTSADIDILSGATVRTLSNAADGLAIRVNSGVLALDNAGTLVGRVQSSVGDDDIFNSGTWTVTDRSPASALDTNAGTDQFTNTATGRIVAAVDDSSSEVTTFADLETFTNYGVIDLRDGSTGDVLALGGDATFKSGSTVRLDLDLAGVSDWIEVAGSATIEAGAQLSLTSLDGVMLEHDYRVLTAAGGITGEFGPLLSAFLGMETSTVGNDAYVRLQLLRDLDDAALSFNETAVARGIAEGSSLHNALLLLPDDATSRDAFNQLSGEVHASGKTALINADLALGQLVANRLRGLFDTVPPATNPVLNYGSQGPEVAFPDFAPAEPEIASWGVVYGSHGEVASDGNAAELATATGGLAGGIDGRVGDWRVGTMASYSQTQFSADDVKSSGESGNYSAGLYAGTQWDALSFRSGLAFTHHDIETTRDVEFSGFSDTLSAEYGAQTLQAFGELGYRLALGDGEMEVFGNLSHLRLGTDGYEESGGDAALSADASEQNATFTTLGVRASQELVLGEMTGTVHGLVGWLHGYGELDAEANHTIGSGGEFLVRGAPTGGDSVQVQAGLDIDLSTSVTLGMGYDGVWSADAIQNGARLGLNAKF